MSEEFETGLNELYTRAAAAHASGAGLPTTALVATARRNRRVRAAAVSMATVAAVVGVGFGGAAAVRAFGDGAPVGPAVSNIPSPSADPTSAILTCGAEIADLPVPEDPPLTIEGTLDTTEVTDAGPLRGSVVVVGAGASTLTGENFLTLRYLVVQDGTVVGIGRDNGDAPVVELSGRDGVAHEFAVYWAGCDEKGLTTAQLPVGEYELYAGIEGKTAEGTNAAELVATDSVLLSGPWPFAITVGAEPDPLPATPTAGPETPQPPEELGVDGVSAAFTEGAPLADGDYIGQLQGIDTATDTIGVDLMVWYSGQAAEDYVAANVPGGEVANDYYLVNDTATVTTLPVAADAPVWEWCFGTTEAKPLSYYQRTAAEWAAAPTDAGGANAAYQCSDEANLVHGSLYWLQVRDGVVVQVTGQYVP